MPETVGTWPVYRDGAANLPGVSAATYLFEGPVSGSGETVDWGRAAALSRHGNMILAGGLSPANVAAAIEAVRPFGVDVSSGVESAPGRKDARLIQQFIAAARAAESKV